MPGDIAGRMRDALRAALRTRDMVAAAALRSALAAIANAEAIPVCGSGEAPATSAHFAGTPAGLAAGEGQCRSLTAAEIDQIVETEMGERQAAAADYERGGHAERAARLRREAQALRDVLDRQPG